MSQKIIYSDQDSCAHCLKHVEWDDGLWANKRVGSNIRHIHRDCWEDFVECEPSDDKEPKQ